MTKDIEIIEVQENKQPGIVRFFRHKDPDIISPPTWFGMEEAAREYREFVIVRTTHEQTLWHIKTKDWQKAPYELRGNFTTIARCQRLIDEYLADQEEKETKRAMS